MLLQHLFISFSSIGIWGSPESQEEAPSVPAAAITC